MTESESLSARRRIRDIGDCLRLLIEQRGWLGLFLVLSFGAAVFEMVGVGLLVPVLQGQGGGEAFSSVPLLGRIAPLLEGTTLHQRLRVVAVAIAVALVLRAAFTYGSELVAAWMPLRIDRALRAKVLKALLEAELSYINQLDVGEMATYIGAYTSNVASTTRLLAQGFFHVLMLALYCVFMALLSWRLTLVVVGALALISMAMRTVTVHWLEVAGRRSVDAMRVASQVTMQILTNMKLIRLSVAEREVEHRYMQSVVNMQTSEFRVTRFQALVQPVFLAFGGLFVASIFFASTLVFSEPQGDWVALLLLFLFIVYRALAPVNALNSLRAALSRLLPSVELLAQFFTTVQGRTPANGSRSFEALARGICFENLTFQYPATDEPALVDLNLDLPPRSMTAVVGMSGAGKSTMVALLARLFDPVRGAITVDGVDLREFDVHSWRRRIGVVSQDLGMLNDTVLANLRFGDPDITFEDVERAVQMANAAKFLAELPLGYETMLGERGVRLSGGQQQRIAIARALLKRPEVLILDEATSHLDSETESAIQSAIDSLREHCTIVVIAHRLSTVMKADRIYVLERGRVAENGRHEQLMVAGGRYAAMVEQQRLGNAQEGSAEHGMALGGTT